MDEHYYLEGGVYWEGGADGADKREDRTDFEIQTGSKNPLTLQLHITTGNGTYTLCGITCADMVRLGKWLTETARDVRRESG